MATQSIELTNLVWTRITNPGKSGTCWKKQGEFVVVAQTDQETDQQLSLSNTNVTIGESKRVPLDKDSGETLPLSADNENTIFYGLAIGYDNVQIVLDTGKTYNVIGNPTYIIGSGETYTTFTLLIASETLVPSDIVDGKAEIFKEIWTVPESGSSGNEITLQNAEIDGESTRDNCIYINGFDYIKLSYIVTKNAIDKAIECGGVTDGIEISNSNISSDDATPIWIVSGDGCLIYDNIVNQGTTSTYGLVFLSAVINSTISNNTFIGAVSATAETGLFLKSCDGLSFNNNIINDWELSDFGDDLVRCIEIDGADFSYNTLTGSKGINFTFSTCTLITGTGNSVINALGIPYQFYNTTAELTDCSTDGATLGAAGFNITGSSVVTLNNPTAINGSRVGDHHGIVQSATAALSIIGGETSGNNGDGVSANDSGSIKVIGHTASNNGVDGSGSSGDGFTSHDTSELNAYFNLSIGNVRDMFGVVEASTGTIYNNTSYNNYDASYGGRGELFLSTTGVFTIKNNVFCNLLSYPVVRYEESTAHVMDYNCYISNLASPFSEDGVAKTFTEWIAFGLGDTNSMFIHYNGADYDIYLGSDPGTIDSTIDFNPVLSTGKLVDRVDNPLIGAGISIAGVTDQNYIDPFGNVTNDSVINIGCDQEEY